MLILSASTMLIFCNYYRLRPYFNNKPYRKKKKSFCDPDGLPRRFHFIRYFDKLFYKKSVLRLQKIPILRKLFMGNIVVYKDNKKTHKFL